MYLRNKILIILIGLQLATVLVFSTLNYRTQKVTLLQVIDTKLYTAALFASNVLPKDYHDKIVNSKSVSTEEYLSIVDKYNKICKKLGLQYLWSLIEIDGAIYFTTGSSTSKDVTKGDHALFFDKHTNPEAYKDAFDTLKIQYSSFHDEWGQGRMVLIPDKDSKNRKYLFAASMNLNNVNQLISKTIFQAAFISCIILILSLFPCLFFAESLSKSIESIAKAAEDIASGKLDNEISLKGSYEIVSLSKSINFMSQAISEKIRLINDSRENLRITLNSIGDGVIATDNKGLIFQMNPVAEKLTGWTADNGIGKHIAEVFTIVSSETKQKVEDPLESILETGKTVKSERNSVLISKNDHEYQISANGAPILNESGVIVGFVLVFRDVTDRLRIEEQLRHDQKMKAIGQLAGGIAHDFNNMLGGIMGAGEMLQSDLSDEEYERFTNIIINASERAAELTQKLLAFSRKGKIVHDTVDMHDVINESVLLVRRTIDPRIKINVNLFAETPFIMGDAAGIENALLNLCVNARDAMPEGGTLNISTANIMPEKERINDLGIHDKYIEIVIADTGAGMSKSVMDRVFEPYFTTKKKGKGTGLGLAAVYGTIKEHKGEIKLNSELNKGTSFKIYLPVTDEIHGTKQTAKSKSVSFSGKVMLVDDEEFFLKVSESMLKDMGFEVVTAKNGNEAVEMYSKESGNFEFLLLDVVMPGMNGIDALAEIRKINSDIKVIFASGFTSDADLSLLLMEDGIEFIQKPFKRSKLESLIKKVISLNIMS